MTWPTEAKDWFPLVASAVAAIGVLFNIILSIYLNRRTLKLTLNKADEISQRSIDSSKEISRATLAKTEDLFERKNAFEQRMVEDKRAYEEGLPKKNALEAFKDDLLFIQRHSKENWFVAANAMQGINQRHAVPHLIHYDKFEYEDFVSLKGENIKYLPTNLRVAADKIRKMMNNAKKEVDNAMEVVKGRNLVEIRKVTSRLMDQFAVYFTLWTAMDGDLEKIRSLVDWDSDGLIEAHRVADMKKNGRPTEGMHLKPDLSASLPPKTIEYHDGI